MIIKLDAENSLHKIQQPFYYKIISKSAAGLYLNTRRPYRISPKLHYTQKCSVERPFKIQSGTWISTSGTSFNTKLEVLILTILKEKGIKTQK
jgi:hypothetical protein